MHDNNMIKITEEKLQHVQLMKTMKTYGKYVVISQEKQRGMLKKKSFMINAASLFEGKRW